MRQHRDGGASLIHPIFHAVEKPLHRFAVPLPIAGDGEESRSSYCTPSSSSRRGWLETVRRASVTAAVETVTVRFNSPS